MNMKQNEYIQYVYEDEEQEIDLKDLLAQILLRWKPILACMLVCAVLSCGVAYMRATTPSTLNERLNSTRAKLTEQQISDVESLRARYLGYQEYQRSLQDDYARYLSNAARASDYVLLNASYYLTSSLEGLESILPSTLLSENDYDALRTLCSEEGAFSSIYNRVSINCAQSNPAFRSSAIVRLDPEDGTLALNYYFLITLYGSSEEECEALLGVIDAAMLREADSLRVLDPALSLRAVDREFSHNVRDYVNTQINASKAILNDVETQMLSLTNNRISKLSTDEKSYYDLLSAEPEEGEAPAVKHISWKKWSVIGVFLGVVLGVGVCFLRYLFDGKIKTREEVELLFHAHTLQSVFLPGRRNLFSKWASALVGADRVPAEEKADLIAADIHQLMRKAGHEKLYIVYDVADVNAGSVVSLVKDRLEQAGSPLSVTVGNPAGSVEELEQLAQAEEAVLFTELHSSSRKIQTSWKELCDRYQIPIAGTVAVEVCW